MSETKENRKHQRAKVMLPMTYKKSKGDDHPVRFCVATDISEGGIRFNTSEFVPLACHMVLEINVNQLDKPVKCVSKVTWIKKMPDGSSYEVGNHFSEIRKKDKETIAKLIKKVAETILAKK